MATATMPRVDDIRLDANPQVFALKFIEGKPVASRYPGGRVMFTAVDNRKLFLNDEEASEFEHALRDLRVQPADFIAVARVTHGRGGGYSIRVKRIDEPADASPARAYDADDAPAWVRETPREPQARQAPTREEALLEKSVAIARQHGAQAFHAAAPKASPVSTEAQRMMSAMCAAIDALAETQAYATKRGMGITFTPEDVRACGLTIYINAEKAAMGARY
jgi:hypothetical protein